MLSNGTLLGGRYKVEKTLSQVGGMASVYLGGLVEQPKQKVAIKFAHTNGKDPTHEDKLLEREAELLSKWEWRHPGIVRLYPIPHANGMEYVLRALEVDGGPYFMVMEYLEGNSLSHNLSKIKKFPLPWKMECFYQLVTTVAFMHQKGYGHRDLKPDNIVFRSPISLNAIPQPVLIDFALASNGQEGSEIVDSSYTLEYAAPERVLKTMGMGYEDVPNLPLEADVWSLGVILYEILTGDLLFKGDRKAISTTLISGNIDVPDRPELTDLLTKFIRGMLSRDPTRRPKVKEILYALEAKFLPPRISTLN